jgi:hypothetical protein
VTAVLDPCVRNGSLPRSPPDDDAISHAFGQYATDKRRRNKQRTGIGVWHSDVHLPDRNRGAHSPFGEVAALFQVAARAARLMITSLIPANSTPGGPARIQ